MNCTYCGIAAHSGATRCAGCGAHSTAAPAEPIGAESSIYERIGRAVVNREPNEALDRLARLGERKDASTSEQKIARAGKVLFCLIILWQFPFVLIPLLGFAAMFFMWIYLPYMGIKRLLSWLTS